MGEATLEARPSPIKITYPSTGRDVLELREQKTTSRGHFHAHDREQLRVCPRSKSTTVAQHQLSWFFLFQTKQTKHSSCSWPQHYPATSCCAVDVGCSSLSITAVVGSDCVLASIPWRKSRGEGRGDSETDRREEGLRGFWLLAPVGGKKKLTRKEDSTFQFLEEV